MAACSWSVDELRAWVMMPRFSEFLACCQAEMHPRAIEAFDPVHVSAILERAGVHRPFLARLLAASALLSGVPDGHWAFLRPVSGLPMEPWQGARWRLARVPCIQQEKAVLRTIMCGWSAERPPDFPCAGIQPDTGDALALACVLAGRTWGGYAACWHWSEMPVAGPSFGLPVFLTLGCAANDVRTPDLLATGKLEAKAGVPTGGVGRVDGVPVKARLAGGGCLLAPKDGFEARAMPSGPCVFPVRSAHDAWEFWIRCTHGANPRTLDGLGSRKIDQFLLLLQTCSIPELDYALRDLRRIRTAIWKHPGQAFPELRQLIKHTSAKSDENRAIRSALLKLIPPSGIRAVADAGHPVTAWHLCMLHIRELNHAGYPDKAHHLFELSRQWELSLPPDDDPDEFIGYALNIVGLLHNRYVFSVEPEHDCPPRVRNWIALADDRFQRGYTDNKPLGDWYGTLGQHYAYAGNFELARAYLDRAWQCFSSPNDRAQNLSYRLFLSMEAKDAQTARNLVKELFPDGLDKALAAGRGCWAIFPALRFVLDIGLPGHAQTLRNLGEALLHEACPTVHPWQLILYNLGLVVDGEKLRAALLNASARLCASRKSGPTVRVMALLPLAALRRLGLRMPGNARDRVEAIQRLIRTSSLNADHFAPVLKARNWKEALDATTKHETTLFPFNYR